MFPWLFNVYMDALMKEEKSEVSGGRREWRLPGLLYADDLVLCGESKENQRAMVECFVEVCRKKRSESQCMMVLGRLECEVSVDGMLWRHGMRRNLNIWNVFLTKGWFIAHWFPPW